MKHQCVMFTDSLEEIGQDTGDGLSLIHDGLGSQMENSKAGSWNHLKASSLVSSAQWWQLAEDLSSSLYWPLHAS